MAIAAGMIGAGLVSGLMGSAAAAEQREQAAQILKDYQEGIDRIRVPSIEEQKIVLRELVSAGIITPEQEVSILQDPSAMMQVATDPRLKDAQMSALAKMQQISDTGITPVEQAAMKKIQSQTAQADAARRAAILQNMAQRGMGGSGVELAAQLQGAQAAAERESQGGLDVAAQMQQRALQAIAQAGTMGGQMRSQDFGEQAAKAEAADAISRFNTQQRAAAQQRNIEALRQAQYANLANKQRISDVNVGLKNQQEMHNKALIQQNFQNELAKQSAKGGVASQMSNIGMLGAQQAAQQWSNIGGAFTQGLGAYGQYSNAQDQRDYDAQQRAEDRKAGFRTS